MAGRREQGIEGKQVAGQHEQAANERKPERQVRNVVRNALNE